MDTLNQTYSDILTTLNRPLVTIKEFDHDSNDIYFTMRNSEDVSITLRMKKTLSLIIEKHFVPGKRLFIHFSRSAYDIESNGSNTLDAFYYVKYEEIVGKQDVGFQGSGYPLPMSSDDYNKMYNKGLCCEVKSPIHFNWTKETITQSNTRTFPLGGQSTSLLNEEFKSINPFKVGLRFETLSLPAINVLKVKGEFKTSNGLYLRIISEICALFYQDDNDLNVDICSIVVSDPLDITYSICYRYSHVRHDRLKSKLVYVDYPTANFYQIETLCPIDEFDYWKAIGEEILSMDDVDEAVKFHKQFYHSKQKFRLVKIQKQLLGEL